MREARLASGVVVAAPEQLHLCIPRMGGKARQDFFEEIVPFDDIRVALANEGGQLFQIRAVQRFRPAGVIGEMDRFAIDRDLQAAKIGPFHALEERLAGGEQVLLRGIAQAEIRDAGGLQRGFAFGEAPPSFQTRAGGERSDRRPVPRTPQVRRPPPPPRETGERISCRAVVPSRCRR